MIELLGHYIIQLIQTTNYFGIFVLMALESALIPIPSEVTMPFSGFLAAQGVLNIWLVIIVGALANLAGSIAAYYLGYALEETVLLKLIKKYGKFVLLDEKEYHRAATWFDKYGDKIVFISRLLPAVRTVISLPAGMFEMNFKKFVIYTTIGCFIWSAFLTYIGYVLGENWESIGGYFHKFDIVIVVVFVLAMLWYIDHKLHFIRSLKKRIKG